ncbi:MAG: TIGR03960 family B12-binding radical SAM protein [Phycisphaerae bacterium]|nr:MAG: TIGR03960 family B12-binding radical SAM protein [Planctomycetota bacterium]KAB2949000.1 MAG: TIGR03960 family B12-binding radical SAM protein [Phycisphaerae bacterium]MCK6463281.1 TIGR03960 family B12-binding radical SAM protein [Phycisphaerae bacterium]MCQ3919399.1 TIGR03960 family B12-binding radical SAM protein [Planctomycetota bacterium]
MNLRTCISEELLPFVKQPGQYIGGEINQLCTEDRWKSAAVRVAVAFPDTYTIGMSHLGCQILYWLINHTPGCAGDRVYAPWTDAEAIMRRKRLPLFTWDTRQPVADADILAISLQYEMSFSTVLTLLDLAQIPFYAADRSDEHPLVIAGGPQADNPEPVAPFLDLVVLGDGEDSMSALLATVKELKAAGVRRRDMILEIARRYDWAYAPAYYEVGYHRDGTVRSIEPTRAGLRSRIERCQTPDFEHAPFPLRPIVPFVEVVHDRFAIEIMRGCPQRCRFCHAGYTKRPLRLRTVDQIMNMAEEMHRATGIEEFGLLSLSTADYPHLRELAERANRQFASRRVNISVPSLRVDKMLANIPWMVNTVRKGGLTIAVEAARDDMREAIRKKVTDGNLLDGVREAYKAGWRSVKLYFMSGFPGERPEDIDGIWELSRQVSEARKAVAGHPASVKASVGWLVPKPYTPFQWAAQPRAEYFAGVRQRFVELMRNQRRVPVKVQMHGIERSILEGVFARGDRRLAPVIERAWRLGARLDGWDECFNPAIWKQAFEEKGIDPDWYAHRERASTEVFPWAHLHGGPPEEYLQNQYDDVFVKIAAPKPRPAAVAV